MSLTGNNYCKFCGDLIEEKNAPFKNVCGPCFCEKLEEGADGE